jgi:hypothetical protein
VSKNIRALPSLLRLSLGPDVPHPDTTGKVPPPPPVAPGLSAAAELSRALALPLDQLDRVLRVATPWLAVPLWFVPEEQDAEALIASGEATRGVVWTRRELLDLLAVPGITPAQARLVVSAKREFAGEVVEVRRGTAQQLTFPKGQEEVGGP